MYRTLVFNRQRRPRDLKLKREVAIKILPEEFSRDADRGIRFQREAEVLASMQESCDFTISSPC
jgi:serine/threonine protein kinase